MTTNSNTLPRLDLSARLEAAIASGHPWIYKNHVPASFNAPAGWVKVHSGKRIAFAIWDPQSQLALRIYSRDLLPDAAWVKQRVAAAALLRADLVADGKTTAFRLINGEGDLLPGVVVDYYEGYAVIVLDSPALGVLLPWLLDALTELSVAGIQIRGIVQRRRAKAMAAEEEKIQQLWGKPLPPRLVVCENGLRLRADLHSGQKTGLFLDHRDNRARIEACSQGRRVLNLFAYSGAFSVYAARGGASHVTSVDVAEAALDDARENFRLNGFDPEAHEFVSQDVFAYLEDPHNTQAFDLVIVDPPSFARRIDQVKQAKKAYGRLFTLAAARVSAGGYLALGSCTARISSGEFHSLAIQATQRAHTSLKIISETGHAVDHPVQRAHPEGRYLKFILGQILRS